MQIEKLVSQLSHTSKIESSGERTYEVLGLDHPVHLTFSFSGQHTFSWANTIQSKIRGVTCSISPGSAVLQQYPIVITKDQERKRLEGVQLELFSRFVLETLRMSDPMQDRYSIWATSDHVGAMPIHALLLSNNEASMELVLKLVCARYVTRS